MFSQSQILQDLPKQFFVNLVAKVNAKQAEGYDVINLGQGNPDQPTYDFIVDALIASAKNPVSHKYSSFRGNAHFKEAVSQFYREHYQVDLNSEKEICVLGGAKIGLVEFPLALMNPGDLLLLPDPGYPDYLSSVALAQIDYATFPLTKANHFLPDLTAIPEDVAKRAKFIYVNYPNNPTGAGQLQPFTKNWWLGLKPTMSVLSAILLTVPWEQKVMKTKTFFPHLELRTSALNYTLSPKPLIWQAGGLLLRLAMLS